MYRTWTSCGSDAAEIARALEGHLNEYAEELLSVGYAVAGGEHYVLAVYRPVEPVLREEAVALAEEIVGEARS